jgi:hypothetical protein
MKEISEIKADFFLRQHNITETPSLWWIYSLGYKEKKEYTLHM